MYGLVFHPTPAMWWWRGSQISRGPSRRYEAIQVPGRNGDLLIDSGAYNNYTQNYEVYFNAEQYKTPSGARAVREWLQKPIGYQRLEDSYDPEYFRMAYYSGLRRSKT